MHGIMNRMEVVNDLLDLLHYDTLWAFLILFASSMSSSVYTVTGR